ncbi:putative transcriptional regulator [Sphingomonas kyeonggiensis]|uniref:ASCH domain-containing protein n=1 Tax=Sphingomonas kyeonggiensis TaxID=1268553 RepID=UPI00278B362D|nr:ASCH domain-containing protein [Sphingomonas kyeonggiensis]MDQ0249554.1 putative transcriptional regulator [Sphingomonas kyeonggiensis]
MVSVDDELLISIRPTFADAIFNGSKSVEVRRKIPPIKLGARLWIYVTKPVGEVRGIARVTEIVEGDPAEVWLACGSRTGLTRTHFDQYFDGSRTAYGLVLEEVAVGHPVSMQALKALRAGFHPPQVITRLTASEAEALHEHLFLG